MKRLIILVILLLLVATVESLPVTRYLLPCKANLIKVSRDSAIGQVGVKELSRQNDGEQIKKYLESVNLKSGNPYCAAGQYWCFASACKDLNYFSFEIPLAKTGSTVTMFNVACVTGYKTLPIPGKDDLMFWRTPAERKGHVERIIEVMKAGWVKTVGFNTNSGNQGSQNEGEGVYFRKRNVNHFLGRMVVKGFIGFKAI